MSSFACIRVVLHSLSLSDALGFIKGKSIVSLFGFLILWARSQVVIHHLTYLMGLSSVSSSQFLALIFILWTRSQVANHHLTYLMDLDGSRCWSNS